MGWWGVALAVMIPWLAAVVWLRSAWPDARPGAGAAILGYAYPLACLVVAAVLWVSGRLGLPFALSGPLILAIAALLLLIGARRIWPSRIGFELVRPVRPDWRHLLAAILLIWMLARFIDLLLELWWQPLFPWDAWTTWLLRARVWSQLGHWVPFVASSEWLADSTTQAQTIAAWNYPNAVSLIGLWSTLGYGEWNETAAKIPWIGCALALALGFYGQARLWGASNLTALWFLWLLATLPLLDSHLALAGYADLWLSTLLLLGLAAGLHWARDGDRRQGLMALGCIVACAFIKQEGMVWSLLFIPAFLGARLSGRWMLALVVAFGLTVAGLWISGGLVAESPWGHVELSLRAIELPLVGRFEIAYHASWAGIWRNLFLYDNWHLFFFGFIPVVGWGCWRLARHSVEPWERAGLVFVLSALGALYVLFFWTGAYRWADDSTSVARLFMHFVPAFTFWALVLWSEQSARADLSVAAEEEPIHQTGYDGKGLQSPS